MSYETVEKYAWDNSPMYECPRCGDKMEARELDYICNECMIRVEKK